MFDLARLKHAVRLGIRGLTANALRSVLTALGIVFGVSAVVVMLAIGEAARYQALKQLQDLGADTIVLRTQKPTEEAKDGATRDVAAFGLTYADLTRLRTTIPTVKSATPMREFRMPVRRADKKLDCRVVTVTPEFIPQNNIPVLRGRGIEPADEAQFANVTVIAAEVAEKLFPAEDPIGKTITIQGNLTNYIMTVVGVTESKTLAAGQEGGGGEFTKVVFIPFETDRVRIGKEILTLKENSESIEKIEVSQITVTVDGVDNVRETAKAVKSMIDQFHPTKDVEVKVPLELLRKTEETQLQFQIISGLIASVSLVVGGIGIMNIMLASVTERTREIGIRRALGAKQRDIALQFLVETVVLSCGGGLLGLALGVGVAYAARAFGVQTQVSGLSMVGAFGVSVLVGLASGLYPARRAARLDPIEALRHT
jgi:putative ABC transport system permease protein